MAQWDPSELLVQQRAQAQAVAGQALPFSLHQGQLFYPYDRRIGGHPWLDSIWQPMVVDWEGVSLGPIFGRYDTYQDRLLFKPPQQAPLWLTDSLVWAFWVGERHFVLARGVQPAAVPPLLREGFREEIPLGEGRVLYVKERKQLLSYYRSNTIDQLFRGQQRLYVLEKGDYHLIRGKRSLRRALPDQRAALRRIFRAEDIRSGSLSRGEVLRVLMALGPAPPGAD